VSNNNDTALRGKNDQQAALAYAKEGNWHEAIRINAQILGYVADSEAESALTFRREDFMHVSVGDIDTLNRLGKAFFEIGDLDNAQQVYEFVCELQEYNQIARRMLHSIERMRRSAPKQREFVDMRTYAIETGKSTLTTLHVDTNQTISLVPGEQLYLRAPQQAADAAVPADATALDVYDANGVAIGRLEPRLAARIIRFIHLGNKYIAAVLRISDRQDQIEIVIRESYRNPENRHEVSFPGKLVDENERRVGFDDIEDDIDDSDGGEEEVEEVEAESDNFGGDDEEHERLETLDSGNDDSDESDE
jgi:tetratricopeptide (TPR) repeat protein